jgi:prohibitin 1
MKYIVAVLLFVFLTGCSVVGPRERGIRFYFGKASDKVVEPGANLWIPFFLGMSEIDVGIQKSEVETSAASRDMQEITTHIALNWAITPDRVVAVYKTIGDEEAVLARIISPAVSEVLKSAASKKTAEEILTKRTEMKVEIDEALKQRLSHYGITISDISIVNLTFSKEFTDAIEQKQIAEQKAKQAEYVALQAIQEAKAEVNRATGRAQAQALLRSSLTQEILQQRAIDKWNGALPQIMSGNTTPFINLKGL